MPRSKSKSRRPNVMMLFGWRDPEGLNVLGNYAREHGWHLDLRTYFSDKLPERWKGDGIIYTRGHRERVDNFVVEQSRRCRVVVINSNIPAGLKAPIVAPDNIEAGRMAAEHLISRGHRDFAFFSLVGDTVANERRTGFEKGVKEANLAMHTLNEANESKLNEPWEKQKQHLVARLHKLPPHLGVLALDDITATDFIEAALEAGRRVPQDISVVGLGNIGAVCECAAIPLTSIDLRPQAVARKAAELLDSLMAGSADPLSQIRIPPGNLIARESSDAMFVHDPRLKLSVEFIRKNIRRSLSLEEIAGAGGISRRSLYNLMHAELKISPADFLRRERTMVAQRLMDANASLSVRETALQAGFSCTRTLARSLAAGL